MSLFAAVIVLINALGTTFGFAVNEIAITSIFTAVLGVFVTLGLIKKEKEHDSADENNSKNQNAQNLPDADESIAQSEESLDNQANFDAENLGETEVVDKVEEISAEKSILNAESTQSNKD